MSVSPSVPNCRLMKTTNKEDNDRRLKSANLLDLPNKVLLKILQYLSTEFICNTRLSCLKLYNLCHFREIMKKQKYVIKSEYAMNNLLNRLIQKDISYFNLEFIEMQNFEDSQLFKTFIRFHGYKINSLGFQTCFYLTQEVMDDIMLYCIFLKELWFDCALFPKSVKSRIKPWHTNTTLKLLRYKYSHDVSEENLIISLLNFYPQIETFKLEGPGRLEKMMAKNVIHKIATYNKRVQNFGLLIRRKDTRAELSHPNIQLQRFKKLSFFCGLRFTLKDLQYLLSHSTKLESLSLVELNHKISFNEMIKMIHKYRRSLKALECTSLVQHFYNDPLNDCLKFLHLKHLTFIFGDPVNSRGVNSELNFLENSQLTYLELRYIRFGAVESVLRIISASQNTLLTFKLSVDCDCKEERNYPLSSSNLQFPKLEVLEIELRDHYCSIGSKEFSNSEFIRRRILKNFKFPRLKKLVLNGIYRVKEDDIEMVINGCPFLEYLEFECYTLEKRIILNLCNSIKFLKTLIICGMEEEIFAPQKEWGLSDFERLPSHLRRLRLLIRSHPFVKTIVETWPPEKTEDF